MRIRRLYLLKYGHFTNADFDLPPHRPDFHMVYGLNEAGKSTALCAIEDLLFGIPHNSPHNFLHDYGSLRVGALVEADERSLEFRRRKGNRDTLMTGGDAPMPAGEAAFGAFLGGADRRFFTRMFCLDHARLRQGGREILEAQDDVGQILYSAAAGIVGLREQIGKMNEEANALWARRASQRKYNLADERLKAAEHAIREHTVTASRWHDLRSALDAASAAYGDIDSGIQTKSAEARKLTRIRRVCRHVRARAELNTAMEALGEVIALPENASRVLESALNDDNQAAARLATMVEQIDSLTRERSALAYDEALLARADDINRLHERRIQVQAGMADLPKRRAELTAAESHLKRLAAELEWETDNSNKIITSIPARAKLAYARALSNRRGELSTAASNARAALDEAEERAQTLRREIEETGSLTDVSALAATIRAVREAGDLTARAATLEGEVRQSLRSIEELLSTMHLRVSRVAALASMAVPPKATLEGHRDAVRALEQNVQSCRNRTQNAERDLLRQTRAYERIAREEQTVPLQELQRLREHRDSGWSIIRRKYVDGSSVPDAEIHAFGSDQTLSDAYQAAVVTADIAADRRFEKAEIVAQLAVSARQIDETRELLDALRAEERALAEQVQALDTAWQRLWNGSVLNPLGADAMLEWIELRSQILEIASRRAATEREAATVRQEEARACDILVRELKSLGVDTIPVAARPLRVIVEMALEIQRRHETSASARKGLEAGFKKATAETGRKRKALEAAEAELKAWQDQWTAAVQSLRLNTAAISETLDAQINAIDELREVANRINDLRHERIDKIERDIAAFKTEVSQMVHAVAPKLADQDPQDAVLELERRLAIAKTARDLAAAADRKLSDARQKAEQYSEMQREARQNIESLQCAASVGSIDELRGAIGRSDRLSSLQRDLDCANEALAEDGDGMAVDGLVAECAEVDLDDVAAREQRVGEELKGLRERWMKAREVQADARREFEAIGGSDRAARAAADRQAAFSEMTDVAEEYVSMRSAVLLLQWAVERYRREKQAPLLKRAGELFSVLTGASFVDLQLEFDEHDKMHLAGVRGNGRTVRVSGLSTGTADQLYLALRIAAVEDFLHHGTALPFVADDLFINFDDDRAAAGFAVLSELAKKTQVLFFTHHQHLLNVANKAIGKEVPTIVLVPQIRGPEAGARHNSREAA
jgi:uncharacterized protein YhaN